MSVNVHRLDVLLATVGLFFALNAQFAAAQTGSPEFSSPLFGISFQRRHPVPGLDSPAIRLPFQCTSDGTIFIGMIQPPDASKEVVASLSPSGNTHLFPLDQVTDLYDKEEVDHYASDSQVIFLVSAARDKKPTHEEVVTSNGVESEEFANAAERHSYILVFDREGNHKSTLRLQDAFHINRVGVFPSGLFLAYGWNELTHHPELALLKEDGTVLEYLSVPAGSMLDSALDKAPDKKGPAVFIAPVQFLPHGNSIVVVQNRTNLPLLDVEESGAIRLIRPKLPRNLSIDMLISSDKDLYARLSRPGGGTIYELDYQSGRILRRFHLGDGSTGANIACVHDGKFLSFEYGTGTLVPLVGTPVPKSDRSAVEQTQLPSSDK